VRFTNSTLNILPFVARINAFASSGVMSAICVSPFSYCGRFSCAAETIVPHRRNAVKPLVVDRFYPSWIVAQPVPEARDCYIVTDKP
jgi:hypothetical protein